MDALVALLNRGAEINACDQEGRSALIRAAKEGHADVIRILLEHGAPADTVSKDGKTALDFAEAGDKADAAALLRDARREKESTTTR